MPPLLRAFRPDVVVAQLGMDSHRTDPLTHLALDVQGFARAVARIVGLAPQLVALGGGGYDLQNVARAWTAAWAVINGVELPAELPASFAEDGGATGSAPALSGIRPARPPDRTLRPRARVRRAPGRGGSAHDLPAAGDVRPPGKASRLSARRAGP